MIHIDSSYEVILTYSPIIEITGHIFECFDYYLYLRNFYKTGIIFFDGLPREQLKIVFETKYCIKFEEIEKDLFLIPKKDYSSNTILKFGKNTFVLLTDGNIESLDYNKIFFATNKLYGFLCEEQKVPTKKINHRITYLQDYRIYGDSKYFESINYVKKIPFDYYKEIRERDFDNTGLMYITYVCRKVTREVIDEYHKKSGCDKTILLVPFKIKEYDSINNVIQIQAPLSDFFEKFDTYIYTPVQRKFDCSPRLITECIFYKKRIFLDLDYVDIGLQTRYNDAVTNLDSLNLNNDVDILRIIDGELCKK